MQPRSLSAWTGNRGFVYPARAHRNRSRLLAVLSVALCSRPFPEPHLMQHHELRDSGLSSRPLATSVQPRYDPRQSRARLRDNSPSVLVPQKAPQVITSPANACEEEREEDFTGREPSDKQSVPAAPITRGYSRQAQRKIASRRTYSGAFSFRGEVRDTGSTT